MEGRWRGPVHGKSPLAGGWRLVRVRAPCARPACTHGRASLTPAALLGRLGAEGARLHTSCVRTAHPCPPPPPPSPAGFWLTQLGTSLPTASTYFLNYIIIHALSTNFFRFIWCARQQLRVH